MSLTSAATALPTPGVAYRLVIPEFDELGAAGQRLWLYLWEATRFGKATARLTDREIAKACGRGLRWVQKAIRQLLNFRPADADPDDPPIPLIDRFRKYGPRDVAGRVIAIVVRFTPPRANDKATSKTKPAPTPARPPQPPQASPAAEAPPEDPEQLRRAAAALRATVAAAEQDRQQARARRNGPTMADAIPLPARTRKIKGLLDPDDLGLLELKEKLGEPLTPSQRQKLEEARGNRSP